MTTATRLALVGLLTSWGCTALHGYAPEVEPRPLPPALRSPRASVEESAAMDANTVARAPAGGAVGSLEGSRTISLPEVLAVAATQANAVLEAAANLDAASGRVQSADGALLPGIDLQLGGSYLDGRQVGSFGEVKDVSFGRFEPSTGVFYRVNPGAALTRSARFRHEADAAAFDVHEARRAAMHQAAVGYLDLTLARTSESIAQRLVADAERLVDISDARADAEIGARADVARADVAAAGARQAAIRARGQWETASIRLAVLLRWDTAALLVPAEETLQAASIVDASASEALHAEAAHARPDIRAAEARSEGATREISAAWWDLLGPEIDASFRERFIGTDFDALGNTNLVQGLARISLDFGELGRTRTAKGEAVAAQVRLRALRERVRGEIDTALSKVVASATTIPEAQHAVSAAERSHESELARFAAGTGLGLEVIAAQQALARARLGLAEAIVRYDVAQIELAAAIGHLQPELLERADASTAHPR